MSGMYLKAKERLWTGNIDLSSTVTTVTAVGVNSALYVVDYDVHQYLSDVTGTVTTAIALTNVTWASGKFTADSITLGTPSSECNAVVVFVSTGVPSTSPLLCYLDDSDGLPAQPGDGQIPIDWDTDLGIITL